jgi:hypothetical protein
MIRLFAPFVVFAVLGCSNDKPAPAVEQTGRSCTSPGQCYSGIDAGALRGAVVCLDRVPGGYCTHECESDGDCCAVPGECITGFKQVCAPFESAGKKMCFLSCEESDIANAPDVGPVEPVVYCERYATSGFRCRSTGGGSENRKACVP